MMETLVNEKPTSDTLDELQSRRENLVSMRDKIRKHNNVLTSTALFAPLCAVFAAWYLYGLGRTGSTFGAVVILYSFIPLAALPMSRVRARQIENDIQELDFRIDLQQFEVSKRETRAEKILRLNDFQLRRYYDLNISQNSWVFGLGIFCITLGIVVRCDLIPCS